MICNRCGNEMKLIGSWGDGYRDPYEEYWGCPECGQGYDNNQAYGEVWLDSYEDDDEDEYDEGKAIDELVMNFEISRGY